MAVLATCIRRSNISGTSTTPQEGRLTAQAGAPEMSTAATAVTRRATVEREKRMMKISFEPMFDFEIELQRASSIKAYPSLIYLSLAPRTNLAASPSVLSPDNPVTPSPTRLPPLRRTPIVTMLPTTEASHVKSYLGALSHTCRYCRGRPWSFNQRYLYPRVDLAAFLQFLRNHPMRVTLTAGILLRKAWSRGRVAGKKQGRL